MQRNRFICYNGDIISTAEKIISTSNRSFLYGDGCFETMKMINGSIALSHYHFERFFSSLHKLKFKPQPYFTFDFLDAQIKQLAAKNQHQNLARIRLTIFREGEGLENNSNNSLNYIIQSAELDKDILQLNKHGLSLGIFTDARKSCDAFSNIKSNNYLPYVMASIWAKENMLDDAIVLNSYNRIADTIIANIFILKNGKIKTPALTEGCVEGVMRRHLLKCVCEENILCEETHITGDELKDADEIFLTNAIRGIRWVSQVGKKKFTNQFAKYLHAKFV